MGVQSPITTFDNVTDRNVLHSRRPSRRFKLILFQPYVTDRVGSSRAIGHQSYAGARALEPGQGEGSTRGARIRSELQPKPQQAARNIGACVKGRDDRSARASGAQSSPRGKRRIRGQSFVSVGRLMEASLGMRSRPALVRPCFLALHWGLAKEVCVAGSARSCAPTVSSSPRAIVRIWDRTMAAFAALF